MTADFGMKSAISFATAGDRFESVTVMPLKRVAVCTRRWKKIPSLKSTARDMAGKITALAPQITVRIVDGGSDIYS